MRDKKLSCKKAMLYVFAGLVLVGIVLGVVLPLTRGGGSSPPIEEDPSTLPPPTPTAVPTVSPTAFAQETKLTASDGAADDQFGYSVAIAGDTIVVGAIWMIMTMAHAVDQLMFSHAQEPRGPSKPN